MKQTNKRYKDPFGRSVVKGLNTVPISTFPVTRTVVGAPQMISPPSASKSCPSSTALCDSGKSSPVHSLTSCLHLCLSSTALCDSGKSSPVHSLTLSSDRLLCLPLLLARFTVSDEMLFARPDDRESCPYHFSFCRFTEVRKSSCHPITACWILLRTSTLVTMFVNKDPGSFDSISCPWLVLFFVAQR